MGALTDAARALLDVAKDCLGDRCAVYTRQFIYPGRPVIDCDTLAASVGDSVAIAISNECQINQTQFSIWVARCCWPTVQDGGAPPPVDAINDATDCLFDDVERIICCLQRATLSGPGIVGHCKPKVLGTRVNNPTGACASVEIQLQLNTIPCCEEEA